MSVKRRTILLGIGALPLMRPGLAAKGATMKPFRYPDPYALTSDDIAWFRTCKSLWIDAESGAPAVLAPELLQEGDVSDAVYGDVERRMEPILCAFFLHATFGPGRYAIADVETGAQSEVEVTETDIKLLQHTNWRAFSVDPKRPYGDFTNYPIDMAHALGHPVTADDKGYATIPPRLEEELVALHHKSQLVLQAYVEHAELEPGDWIIPVDGWEGLISPRCRPVGQAAVKRYQMEMVVLAGRARFETTGSLVGPLMRASAALFGSP